MKYTGKDSSPLLLYKGAVSASPAAALAQGKVIASTAGSRKRHDGQALTGNTAALTLQEGAIKPCYMLLQAPVDI